VRPKYVLIYVSWPDGECLLAIFVCRSLLRMWSWHKLNSKETREIQVSVTQLDFLKGTRYEELATTFSSDISPHSYLHVFRISWFFFGVALIIYSKFKSRTSLRITIYKSSVRLKFLIQLTPTIFSLEFKLVSSVFDRLSKSVVPAIMKCRAFRKNRQIWRAPEKRKELSDWREGISGTRLARFLQTTL